MQLYDRPSTTAVTEPQLRRMLETDRTWGAYALADLQPEMAPYCAWYMDPDERGLALIYSGLSIPTLFTFGEVAGVAAGVAQIDLPPRVYITVREEHFSVVDRYYDFSADYRPMRRMTLPPATMMSTVLGDDATGAQPVIRLTAAMSDALAQLYAHGGPFAPDAFAPEQLDNGAFYGIQDETGALAAAGGTHIIDWTAGVGAIGNMYTRPDQRGRGHAGVIVQAIVNALRAGDVSTIVLNVDQRNSGAQRLYERHGFVEHCPYIEGIGARR